MTTIAQLEAYVAKLESGDFDAVAPELDDIAVTRGDLPVLQQLQTRMDVVTARIQQSLDAVSAELVEMVSQPR